MVTSPCTMYGKQALQEDCLRVARHFKFCCGKQRRPKTRDVVGMHFLRGRTVVPKIYLAMPPPISFFIHEAQHWTKNIGCNCPMIALIRGNCTTAKAVPRPRITFPYILLYHTYFRRTDTNIFCASIPHHHDTHTHACTHIVPTLCGL